MARPFDRRCFLDLPQRNCAALARREEGGDHAYWQLGEVVKKKSGESINFQ